MQRNSAVLAKVGMVAAMLCGGIVQAQAASISGKVMFEGEAPKPAPIAFGAEKQCAEMHKDKMPVQEDIVVNPNGTVKWALVHVKETPPGTFAAPAEPVVIDQTGCIFAPHGVAARAGQQVIFKNNDPVLHNVRTESKANKVFNIAQPIQGMQTKKVFDKAETGIKLRCDVHFWMTGYVHVMDHPFFAVTGEEGTFTIKDIPAGTYTLELWHERLGTQSQTVTVAAADAKDVTFTLKKPN